MTPEELTRRLQALQRDTQRMLGDKAPRGIAALGQAHFRANFSKGGFVDGGLHPWPVTRRQRRGDPRGPLLSEQKRLQNATVGSVPGPFRAAISNATPYAAIHNEGGTTHPTVTPKMRAYAWHRYFESAGRTRAPRGVRNRQKRRRNYRATAAFSMNTEALFWRGLALTKKKRLDIVIPQRRFIGPSREFSDRINVYLRKQTEELLRKHNLL